MGLLDTIYTEAKKERGPFGLRVGDFVPYVSGLLAADDARLAAQQGNYGEAAGALAGLVPGGRLVKKLTGVDMNSVSPRQIFAGAKARGADLNAMQRAEQRLSAGDDPRKVWAEEGWFRGPDGKMRWEIDDSKANPNFMTEGQSRYLSGRASDETVTMNPFMAQKLGKSTAFVPGQFHHNDLFGAYPDLGGVYFNRLTEANGPSDAYFKAGGVLGAGEIGGRTNNAKDTVLHELQHAVQRKEGFARGGNPEMSFTDKDFPKFVEMATKKIIDRKKSEGSFTGIDEAIRREAKDTAAVDFYRSLAGETEARLAGARGLLTPAERKSQYPGDYYDVPAGKQIVRGLFD